MRKCTSIHPASALPLHGINMCSYLIPKSGKRLKNARPKLTFKIHLCFKGFFASLWRHQLVLMHFEKFSKKEKEILLGHHLPRF